MKLIIAGLLLVGAFACGRESTPTPSNTAISENASLPSGYSRVEDTSQVCMVTNQYMGRAQIPVAVDNRTYYGCCPMCKDRLNNEPATRTARDPVTGESVDKASAVIVKAADGSLLYFASERSLRQFRG
ncbi:MAG: TRASH domain-containing protein [Kofleriaceae bacterium]